MALLTNGSKLTSPSSLVSPNGGFEITMQDDGNLVVYRKLGATSEPLWASNTCGKGIGPYRLEMQKDNHLVIYDSTAPSGKATWASNTCEKGKMGAHLCMQDDGNAVIYDGNGNAMWASRTERGLTGKRAPDDKWGSGDLLC